MVVGQPQMNDLTSLVAKKSPQNVYGPVRLKQVLGDWAVEKKKDMISGNASQLSTRKGERREMK